MARENIDCALGTLARPDLAKELSRPMRATGVCTITA